MKIRFRGPTIYFMRFVAQAKIILDTWAKFVGSVIPMFRWDLAQEMELGRVDPDRLKR